MSNQQPPAIDWSKFQVERSEVINGHLVVEVKYADGWTNWGGLKIMVFANVASMEELLERVAGSLDPHFKNTGFPPIARFPPTAAGWKMACGFAQAFEGWL